MTKNTYTVFISKENKYYLADIPCVPGTHTYALSMEDLTINIKEAIAVALNLNREQQENLVLNITDTNIIIVE